jgi:acetyltransferase-like isoleucine patch superfamily enzyme
MVRLYDPVTIGDGAVVGAPWFRIPPYAVVAGNPAAIRKFGFRRN